MDTPATESNNAALSVQQAASFFTGEPAEQEDPAKVVKPEAAAEPEQAEAEPVEPTEDDAPAEEVQKVTIEVDGKTVELTPAQIAEAYKNGLRQEDYTKKTMAAAEQRKAADAEASQAREQRRQMAEGLQHNHTLLVAALQEQDKIDWDALLQQDAQEYLKQKHLYERRQAALQNTIAQTSQLNAFESQERLKTFAQNAEAEHQAALDKLPEWKDEKKAAAEKKEIAEELLARGYPTDMVFGKYNPDGTPVLDRNGNIVAPGLLDHKTLLLARDAMLYRKMMGKAKAAAEKVQNLPQKVVRPGVSETNVSDGRTAAIKQLQRTGSLRDAGKALEKLF